MPSIAATRTQPWASGPGEILQHGLDLLKKDSDANRRLAMLSIDNAVELMIKTYLGLPKKVTGIQISRRQFEEVKESFPQVLEALETYASEKLEGVDVSELEWYHRLRNQLYHEGNGLTVERQKVVVYAEIARVLFQRLFGFELEIRQTLPDELVGEFISGWADVYQLLEVIARAKLPPEHLARVLRSTNSLARELVERGHVNPLLYNQVENLRQLRNRVTHGNMKDLNRSVLDGLQKVVRELGDIARSLESR
jgi:hypothetical protein